MFSPGKHARVVFDINRESMCPFQNGTTGRSAVSLVIAKVDWYLTQIGSHSSFQRDDIDIAGNGIGHSDPRHLELSIVYRDPTCFIEKRMKVLDPDNCLIDIA